MHPVTGRLYVATKGIFGGELYAAPPELADDAPNVLGLVGETTGIVTDGAFFPDGEHLVLRTYTNAVVYSFPALEQVGSFDLPSQEQGEGIAVASSRARPRQQRGPAGAGAGGAAAGARSGRLLSRHAVAVARSVPFVGVPRPIRRAPSGRGPRPTRRSATGTPGRGSRASCVLARAVLVGLVRRVRHRQPHG